MLGVPHSWVVSAACTRRVSLNITQSTENALRKALEEYNQVKHIIDCGIQDYDTVQRLVLTKRIRIPISYRGIVKRLFRAQSARVIETPGDIHKWLKEHYSETQNVPTFPFPG